ncbi:KUP/HAK/KT family potassium transporter [Spirosoma sp. RP8]|uniref:Probable potassium transport system protein Kup n=1 Tax=Spirosoma liriopis TaxID=2937440 RepID=A0ABT0HLB8_9BACT|nr:KUP/HAK/KT family potassium transporter [Spirosoma liriopis]MCK8492652.1 KUP/HAK/KT family potassium transporter [Spirosoma liriopis]
MNSASLPSAHSHLNKVSLQGLLISIGIVFGDIGTSPLYTYKAIFGERILTENLVLGSFSAVFWTLTFQTTLKYVIITLNADNNGEGGIFSLYTLVRRYTGRWMLYPAIVGGSFLLADGIITPPISVSSAIEGLLIYYPKLDTVPIVLAIIVLLFITQQFGTQWLGRLFGPIMVVWFAFIGIIGFLSLVQHPGVLRALNPWHVVTLLRDYPGGFWLLGGVFLCTTGAEALYSDMGHCGRGNIRVSWGFVKLMLLLSYAGQAAWLMQHLGKQLGPTSSFYEIVPPSLLIFAIGIATLATIIASQALISGSFTLIGEAIRLKLWPRQRVVYPTDFRGQLYIPQINWLLMAGCIGVVLHFRESKNMEAAFGLAVTLTMLMSTVLMNAYLRIKRVNPLLTLAITLLFLGIESSFLIANLIKFEEGGWISILLGLILITVMTLWHRGKELKHSFVQFEPLPPFLETLKELSNDTTVPKYATHLVYLTSSDSADQIETETIESILYRSPKRADVYWLLHVEVMDEPFTMRYKVETLADQDVYYIKFFLGFRIEPRLNLFFRLVVEDMVKDKEVEITSRYQSLSKKKLTGDFRFVVFKTFLSYENDLPLGQKLIMNSYFLIRRTALHEAPAYGLDTNNIVVEDVPLLFSIPKNIALIRERN